jgi:hypothetical protein
MISWAEAAYDPDNETSEPDETEVSSSGDEEMTLPSDDGMDVSSDGEMSILGDTLPRPGRQESQHSDVSEGNEIVVMPKANPYPNDDSDLNLINDNSTR